MATYVQGRKVEVSRLTWVLIGILAAAVAVPSWILMYLLYHFSPSFDHGRRKTLERPADANWQLVHQLGAKAWQQLSPETYANLNGGDWTFLCVHGGHSDPVATLEGRLGAERIAPDLRARFGRSLPVSDYDLAVSFADRAGKLESLYFVDGGSMQSMWLSWCTGR